jgi:hypothetical protein
MLSKVYYGRNWILLRRFTSVKRELKSNTSRGVQTNGKSRKFAAQWLRRQIQETPAKKAEVTWCSSKEFVNTSLNVVTIAMSKRRRQFGRMEADVNPDQSQPKKNSRSRSKSKSSFNAQNQSSGWAQRQRTLFNPKGAEMNRRLKGPRQNCSTIASKEQLQ